MRAKLFAYAKLVIWQNSNPVLRLGLMLVICASAAFGQNQTTGRIAGTVKDPNGALITGAEVTVKSKTTAAERITTTDNQGSFTVSLLPPGLYQLRVTAAGFHPLNSDSVQVGITETTTVNAELTLGVDTITVDITQLIQKDGPQLGRAVNSNAVSDLPLATRNFTQIMALSPGTSVSLPDNNALGRNSQNVSVNGARVTQNDFEINGIDANNLATNAAASVAVPAPETILEFKVQTSLYPATFGRGAGGSIQAVTKSGSNNFHGAAYEYFQNDALNANNPFLKAAGVLRPTLQRNIFGGLIGGPIKTDRLFFFGSYQGTRERNGASVNSLTSNVLIAPGLTDDRSQQNLLTTFRPRSSPTAPPATSINPVALALLNTKLPNGQFLIPTPLPDGHYSGSAVSTYREDQFNTNVDYRINEKSWLAVRFFFSNAPQFLALPNNGANVPGFGADLDQDNRLLSVQNIHSFSPRIINEARAGYSFIRANMFGQNPVRDSDLGIKRANASVYPGLGSIRIGPAGTNALAIGNSGANIDTENVASSTTLADILSIVHGPHSIRTGAQIIFYRNTLAANNNRRGTIAFQSFNNFLLGLVNNSVYGDGITERFLRAADYSFFFQDDWRVSRRLTLNLGLRYELDLPPYETRGALSTFDPALYQPRMQVDSSGNPIGPPLGGFVQAGNVVSQFDLTSVPNVSKRVVDSVDPNNFAPRVGFAYSPRDSLVVRGGYGIYYSRPSNAYIGTAINAPPLYTVRRSPAGGTVPFADPFFPLPSQDQFPALVSGVALAGQIFDRGLRTAYFHQYNAGVQYLLRRDLLIEVAYVGTRGLNLIRDLAINQAQLASPQHPIVNAVTGQAITTNTPANAALRAPYQGVEVGSFLQIQSTAQSTFNSLQMSLTKRLSRGLQFLASYTYGKSIDNASGGSDSTGEARDTINIAGNQLDNRANRGLSDFDRTHRFVLSYFWDVRRPAFASHSNAGKLLLANWQIGGIVTAMSGLPIDVTDGGAGSLYGLNGGNNAFVRPSWASGANGSTANSNIPAGYFFNPLAFVRPVVLAGQIIPSSNGTAIANATGTDFGNVGRNVLRGPGQVNVDFSVIKRFPFAESRNVELRAEFFNLFNHPNFANPVSNLSAIPTTSIDANTGRISGSPGDFGRIVSTSNNPRLIQFAVKLNF
jgi:hypothetical protein